MVPPHTFPFCFPWSSGFTRQSGLRGFPFAALHSECPGRLIVYRRAVDIGTESVLKALAVYALATAIAWLPGHAAVGSSVETTTAQTSPERLTIAAHSKRPTAQPSPERLTIAPHAKRPEATPPASPWSGAAFKSFRRSSAEGRSEHPPPRCSPGTSCFSFATPSVVRGAPCWATSSAARIAIMAGPFSFERVQECHQVVQLLPGVLRERRHLRAGLQRRGVHHPGMKVGEISRQPGADGLAPREM